MPQSNSFPMLEYSRHKNSNSGTSVKNAYLHGLWIQALVYFLFAWFGQPFSQNCRKRESTMNRIRSSTRSMMMTLECEGQENCILISVERVSVVYEKQTQRTVLLSSSTFAISIRILHVSSAQSSDTLCVCTISFDLDGPGCFSDCPWGLPLSETFRGY